MRGWPGREERRRLGSPFLTADNTCRSPPPTDRKREAGATNERDREEIPGRGRTEERMPRPAFPVTCEQL
jgi:hypothetical protein